MIIIALMWHVTALLQRIYIDIYIYIKPYLETRVISKMWRHTLRFLNGHHFMQG